MTGRAWARLRAGSAGPGREGAPACAASGRIRCRADDVRGMVGLAVRAANAGNPQIGASSPSRTPACGGHARGRATPPRRDAAWPELAEAEREAKALRAYATFFADAPLVMAVFSLPYSSRGDELLQRARRAHAEHDRLRARPDLQSVGAAVQLLCTAAHALGYGACWMTAPVLAAPAIERLLGVAPPAQPRGPGARGRPWASTSPPNVCPSRRCSASAESRARVALDSGTRGGLPAAANFRGVAQRHCRPLRQCPRSERWRPGSWRGSWRRAAKRGRPCSPPPASSARATSATPSPSTASCTSPPICRNHCTFCLYRSGTREPALPQDPGRGSGHLPRPGRLRRQPAGPHDGRGSS